MTFTVLLKPENGHFTASLVGAPEVRATGNSRDASLSGLREQISLLLADGELTMLDVPSGSVAGVVGRFADDPTLQDICDEAYRARDVEME